MKVKLIGTPGGTLQPGDVVEALIAPNGAQGYVFDSSSIGWFIYPGSYEVVPEEPKASPLLPPPGFSPNLVEKPKKLVVEY